MSKWPRPVEFECVFALVNLHHQRCCFLFEHVTVLFSFSLLLFHFSSFSISMIFLSPDLDSDSDVDLDSDADYYSDSSLPFFCVMSPFVLLLVLLDRSRLHFQTQLYHRLPHLLQSLNLNLQHSNWHLIVHLWTTSAPVSS